MNHSRSPLQAQKRSLTRRAWPLLAMCGVLLPAPQGQAQGTEQAEAIAALARVGGVVVYNSQKQPIRISFLKGEREVDDAALANLAKLDTLLEVDFPGVGLGAGHAQRHPLVTDEGLAHLRGLRWLQRLDLTYTGVRGPGLVHLQNNKHLRWLVLWDPPLGDEGLKYLAKLDSLTYLLLGDNGTLGKGLANLAGLTNLRSLSLRCKAINSEGLAHLSRMNFLTDLSLRVPELNQFEFLRNFMRLTDLSLQGTSVADADLANLAGLKQLMSIDLSDTQIGDRALRHLAGLSNLQKLDLAGTRITNAGLDQLTGLSRCKELNLRRTAVTPVGIARLSARYPATSILLD
jgi:hypothetical protein